MDVGGAGFDTRLGEGLPAPKRVRTEMTAHAVHPTPTLSSMASAIARATQQNQLQPMGITNFKSSNSANMSSRLPITARGVGVYFTSPGDFDYAKYMQKSHLFSIFDSGDGVVRLVHLNRLNKKLRDDHAAYLGILRNAQAPVVAPIQIGIGAKRNRVGRTGTHPNVTTSTGIVTIEQLVEHVRYIGMMPLSDKRENWETNPGRNTLERAFTAQYGGEIGNIMNIWGEVRTGDRLVFEVTRLNNLTEASPITGMESFGPLQIVPRVHHSLGNATGSSMGPHNAWLAIDADSQDLNPRLVLDPDTTKDFNPTTSRIGSVDPGAFDMYAPIRELAPGNKPYDSVHWGPAELKITDTNGSSQNILYKKLVPNIVIPVGFVDTVNPIALHGLPRQRLHAALMDPSGKEQSLHNHAPIDVILTVNSR